MIHVLSNWGEFVKQLWGSTWCNDPRKKEEEEKKKISGLKEHPSESLCYKTVFLFHKYGLEHWRPGGLPFTVRGTSCWLWISHVKKQENKHCRRMRAPADRHGERLPRPSSLWCNFDEPPGCGAHQSRYDLIPWNGTRERNRERESHCSNRHVENLLYTHEVLALERSYGSTRFRFRVDRTFWV